MKNIYFLISLIFFTINAYSQTELHLVENNASKYRMVIPTNADKFERKAANILQHYIALISNAQIPICSDTLRSGKFEICIGATNRQKTGANPQFVIDGFRIKTRNKKLFLNGKNRGIIYATTYLLENYLNCLKLSANEEDIPKNNNISLNPLDISRSTKNTTRIIYSEFSKDTSYNEWRKLDFLHLKIISSPGLFVHTAFFWVSPQKYFQKHPEYFSQQDGNRINNGQLCLSNPDLKQIIINSLQNEIKTHPNLTHWGISQNDNQLYCQCKDCQLINNEEGTQGGTQIRLLNEIAAAFPSETIVTLAYQFTRKPPQKTKPKSNILVILAGIEINRGQSLATDPRSQSFRTDLENWTKLTSQIMIWDYQIQFTNYLSPFPIFHTLQSNIQYFNLKGITSFFEQTNGFSGAEFAELKSYVLSELIWDPAKNVDRLVDRFLAAYYGKAASYIREYFNILHQNQIENNQFLDIYGHPHSYISTFLSPSKLKIYDEIFQKAEQSVFADSICLKRVRRARLSIDYAKLTIAMDLPFGKMGWFVDLHHKKQLDTAMLQVFHRFILGCKINKITSLNEMLLTTNLFEENVQRFLNQYNSNYLNYSTKLQIMQFERLFFTTLCISLIIRLLLFVGILKFGFKLPSNWPRILFCTIIPVSLTLPYFWYVLPQLISNYTALVLTGEGIALLSDFLICRITLKLSYFKAFLLAIIVNLATYLADFLF